MLKRCIFLGSSQISTREVYIHTSVEIMAYDSKKSAFTINDDIETGEEINRKFALNGMFRFIWENAIHKVSRND